MAAFGIASPTFAGQEAFHIAGPARPLKPGETHEFRIEPRPATDLIGWTATMDGITESFFPPYRAPYVVSPGGARITLTAVIYGEGSDPSAPMTQEIEVLSGAVPGAEDCLGPGQEFSTVYGKFSTDGIVVDELPSAIERVEPVDPRNPRERAIPEVVIVRALVCKTGQVIDGDVIRTDTYPAPPGRDQVGEAAVAAVLQWKFSPARTNGQPVAVTVMVPVRFGP